MSNSIICLKHYSGVCLLIFISGLLFIMLSSLPAIAKEPAEAGMVLSVTGKAQATGSGKKSRSLDLMAVIREGDTVQTEKNSTLIFVLFSSGDEYTLKESSVARVDLKQVTKVSGELKRENSKVSLNLPKNSKLYSRKIMGESLRNGANTFDYPVQGSCVPTGKLTFKWSFQSSSMPEMVRFELKDATSGKIIYKTHMEESFLSYPPRGGEPLEYGKKYSVKVFPADPDAGISSELSDNNPEADFSVLPENTTKAIIKEKELTEDLIKRSPEDTMPIMKMMFIYFNNNMFPEALEMGLNLQKKMSGNPEIYYHLSNIYAMMGDREKYNECRQKEEDLRKRK